MDEQNTKDEQNIIMHDITYTQVSFGEFHFCLLNHHTFFQSSVEAIKMFENSISMITLKTQL